MSTVRVPKEIRQIMNQYKERRIWQDLQRDDEQQILLMVHLLNTVETLEAKVEKQAAMLSHVLMAGSGSHMGMEL